MTINKENFKYELNHYLIIGWFILYGFASILFFAPVVISLSLFKVLSWLFIGATFTLCLPSIVAKKYHHSRYGRIMQLWTITIFLSILTAYFHHYQGVIHSFRTILDMLPLTFFFFLTRSNIKQKEIERIIWLWVVAYCIMYLIGKMMAPSVIFDHTGGQLDVNTQRGTSKIRILGDGYIYLGYFLAINKWLVTKKIKYITIATALFILIVLGVSRQHILFSFLLGLLMFFTNSKWYKKLFLIISVSIGIFLAVQHSNIIQNLISLTISQVEESGSENIRILSLKYYFLDYNNQISQIIFGNGIPHLKSTWGIEYNNFTKSTGLFPSDVGLAKIFFFWGVWGLMLFITLSVKVIKQKASQATMYTKYFFIFVLSTTIASHSFFGYLFPISIVLYVLEISHNDKQLKQSDRND